MSGGRRGPGSIWSKLLWFALLWGGGVAAVAAASLIIRAFLKT